LKEGVKAKKKGGGKKESGPAGGKGGGKASKKASGGGAGGNALFVHPAIKKSACEGACCTRAKPWTPCALHVHCTWAAHLSSAPLACLSPPVRGCSTSPSHDRGSCTHAAAPPLTP